jgi:tetratricopeptide (TPR) repeat protein
MTRHFRMLGLAVLLIAPLPALAAGGEEPSTTAKDPVIEQALAANAAKDYVRSAAILKDALARNPNNADYHNLYAYALRKGPNPEWSLVFKHYEEALRIDPDHRKAHEYLGEAYLMTGDLAKAKEQLAALDRLCTFGCDEYSDLKKSVAAFEQIKRR